MKKFRKKPVVIEAVQITKELFDPSHPNHEEIPGLFYDPRIMEYLVETPVGFFPVRSGDWIIRRENGNLDIPIKNEVFEAFYEAVEDES